MPVVAVIDDEPIACDVVAGILRDGGTDVHTATTAETGLALLTSRYFDLALIDVRLRDGSGIKLAEIAANQNTLVLLMTGHAETASYLKQFDFPRLLKPFDLGQLIEATALAMADRHRTVQRLIDGLARMHANLAGLDVETANARRLIATSREIVDRAKGQALRLNGSGLPY
jgi:DNA-binding NtrC family response regulator